MGIKVITFRGKSMMVSRVPIAVSILAIIIFSISQHCTAEPTAVQLYPPADADITEDSVKLTWSRSNDPNFASYEIHILDFHNQVPSNDTLYAKVAQNITSRWVTNLEPDTTYYFIIRVVDLNDTYNDSNEIQATTKAVKEEGGFATYFLYIIIGGIAIAVIIVVIVLAIVFKRKKKKEEIPTEPYQWPEVPGEYQQIAQETPFHPPPAQPVAQPIPQYYAPQHQPYPETQPTPSTPKPAPPKAPHRRKRRSVEKVEEKPKRYGISNIFDETGVPIDQSPYIQHRQRYQIPEQSWRDEELLPKERVPPPEGGERFELYEMPKPVKPKIVRCPKCKGLIEITSLERPIEVVCPACGGRGVLRK